MKDRTLIHIETEDAPGGRILRLKGELSVVTNERLRPHLVAGLQPGARTVLDAEGIESVDIGGLQLLCAAHRTYKSIEAGLEWGSVSPVIHETARAAGFRPNSTCPFRDDNCLWK